MEIKTVAVLGAGAVGSYIIWGLDKKVKLGVIGEGDRRRQYSLHHAADPEKIRSR